MSEADSREHSETEGRDIRRIPDIISLVKDTYAELRPAERRVADVVLDDVKYAVDASNAALAQRAGVSEPTVTRFCRAIGCEGVRDFKLKLAQSLVVGALYLDTSPGRESDNGMPYWNAVFGEARRALQEAERQLDPGQLEKAAELIARARQVTVFGLGGSSSALAQETQYRLFRYGITVSAQCDPYLMRMTASTLKPGDLVIAISATGRTREVIEAVELAKHYRANAIAVTAPDTELARACDVRLTVAVPEYPDTLKPTASRYAFLAMIDLLAVASAYKLDGSARETVRRIDRMLDIAPTKQAAAWLHSLAQALEAGDATAASNLFVDDCYWRDLLAFTWNVTTMEGRDAIAGMLGSTLATTKPHAWRITGEATSEEGTIEAWFTFETAVATGQGILRLREGRCRTLFTAMTELKGFEERKGQGRPLGVRHKADPERETWSEARAREARDLGASEQPYCLVIGGGQGGIMLGARLRQLGVPTIVIEKNARPGDSWRNRYRTLVLHDPVWYDHLPYIPFPDNWPVFTPKDKMGDWLEMYTRVMELNYWVATKCLSASYDDKEKVWTVVVDRVGRRITLKPKHIVFATGAYGPPRKIDLEGADRFKGELLHSSQYASGEKYRGRRVAVIGAASSGHDVCVDLWESGADVTMIQRSPTTVVKSDTLMQVGFEIFSEDALARGITTEKADMIVASTPFALVPKGQRALYDVIRARDADFYERLAASGFALDFGDDETGLLMKAYRTGSGYYIDVGASDLIIDGKIGIRSGVPIKALTEKGILFEDGTELEADAIIACTGYQSMNENVAALVSREVADKVGPCWGLGSGVKGDPGPWQGELRNMWKPTAQEALWFHGGNLALSRFYSKYVALQIKARMEGIDTQVYGPVSNARR